MGEMKAQIFTIGITLIFIFPLFLQLYILSSITDHFYKATNEVTQMIKVNGGYTKNVENAVGSLTLGGKATTKATAIDVSVLDESGDDGKREVGRYVQVGYSYTYYGMYKTRFELGTTAYITMDKR